MVLTNFLNKIILVFNDINNKSKEGQVKNIKQEPNYLNIICGKRLNPGEARNLGLDSNKDKFIAFLDVSTIPEDKWLEKALCLIHDKNINGVLGNTKYLYKTSFEKSFIAATFGEQNLGELFQEEYLKKVLKKVGYFLPNLRSGEDKEWTNRCKQLDHQIYLKNDGKIYYNGIINKVLQVFAENGLKTIQNYAHDYSIK